MIFMSAKYYWNKIYWFFIKPLRTLYRFLVRPRGHAAKVLVQHGDAFLLVRPSYGHKKWSVPGGGVKRGETYEDAARRELQEEVNLTADTLVSVGEYETSQDFQTDTIHCFYATSSTSAFVIDGVEIKEAGWFKPDELPSDRVSRVDKILALYKGSK